MRDWHRGRQCRSAGSRITPAALSLTAAELRGALFQKGAHPLPMVLGLATTRMRLRFAIQQGTEIHRGSLVDIGFHVAVTDERASRDAFSYGHRFFPQFLVCHHSVHQTDLLCFGSGDEVREKE